jgi:hypothetical protein
MRVFWLCLALCFIASSALAGTVTFVWDDPNLPEVGVTGYRIYYGPVSRKYVRAIATRGKVQTLTIKHLPPGRYFAAATAHDAYGNSSQYSEEIEFNVDIESRPTGKPRFINFKSILKE